LRPRSVADLTGLAFNDCACLGVLVRHCAEIRARDGSFALAAPQDAVCRTLAVTRPISWFGVHDTVGQAVAGARIGYDIRPSARRQGHATAMLATALPVASGLGIDPALLTCDQDNIGSWKVIEANGGALVDQQGGRLRYWVPTSSR
jgi:GNAT superfamily N-acetyltransferase